MQLIFRFTLLFRMSSGNYCWKIHVFYSHCPSLHLYSPSVWLIQLCDWLFKATILNRPVWPAIIGLTGSHRPEQTLPNVFPHQLCCFFLVVAVYCDITTSRKSCLNARFLNTSRVNFLVDWGVILLQYSSSTCAFDFYRGAIESVLTDIITKWHDSCKAQDRKTSQQGSTDNHLASISETWGSQRISETAPTPATARMLWFQKLSSADPTDYETSWCLQAVRFLNASSDFHHKKSSIFMTYWLIDWNLYFSNICIYFS